MPALSRSSQYWNAKIVNKNLRISTWDLKYTFFLVFPYIPVDFYWGKKYKYKRYHSKVWTQHYSIMNHFTPCNFTSYLWVGTALWIFFPHVHWSRHCAACLWVVLTGMFTIFGFLYFLAGTMLHLLKETEGQMITNINLFKEMIIIIISLQFEFFNTLYNEITNSVC